MKRVLSRRFAFLSSVTLALLLVTASFSTPQRVHAQSGQLTTEASTLYKFQVSSNSGGYMLTGIPQRGTNLNYTNLGSIFPTLSAGGTRLNAGIVLPPASNYTPTPGQQLVPLYQWRVVQGSRTYYYYATVYQALSNGYYFEGLVGYVLPSNFTTSVINGATVDGAAINYYYSQTYGYWYSANRPELEGLCFPDSCSHANTTFRFQGVGFKLPIKSTQHMTENSPGTCGFGAANRCPVFTFDPPYVPPPPVCEPADEQYCYDSGGSWDYGNCSCNYYYNEYPQYRSVTPPPQ